MPQMTEKELRLFIHMLTIEINSIEAGLVPRDLLVAPLDELRETRNKMLGQLPLFDRL